MTSAGHKQSFCSLYLNRNLYIVALFIKCKKNITKGDKMNEENTRAGSKYDATLADKIFNKLNKDINFNLCQDEVKE